MIELADYNRPRWDWGPRKVESFVDYKTLIDMGQKATNMIHQIKDSILPTWRLHDVDEMFFRMCKLHHVQPCLLGHNGYTKSLFTNPNNTVAYGIPAWNKKMNNVGLLGIDLEICSKEVSAFIECAHIVHGGHLHLVKTTQDAILAALGACKAGVSTRVVETMCRKVAVENGYGMFIAGCNDTDSVFQKNTVYTIECILNAGSQYVVKSLNGPCEGLETIDGAYSAHLKHCIVIDDYGNSNMIV